MVNGMVLARHLSSFSQLLSATGVEREARKRGGGVLSAMLFLLTSPRPDPILYYDWIVLEDYKLGLIGTIMVSIPQR